MEQITIQVLPEFQIKVDLPTENLTSVVLEALKPEAEKLYTRIKAILFSMYVRGLSEMQEDIRRQKRGQETLRIIQDIEMGVQSGASKS